MKLPRTDGEIVLHTVWARVLSIPKEDISIDQNFFSIGGDSLRSVQVVAECKKEGWGLSVQQLFNNPTIETAAPIMTSLASSGPAILGTSTELLSSRPIFTVKLREEGEEREEDKEEVEGEEDEEEEEYPLIGINQAHYVGLYTSSFAAEGMTPQIYFEWCVGQQPSQSTNTHTRTPTTNRSTHHQHQPT